MKRSLEEACSDEQQQQEETACKARCLDVEGPTGGGKEEPCDPHDADASKNAANGIYDENEQALKGKDDEKPKDVEQRTTNTQEDLDVEAAAREVESKCGLQIAVDKTRLQVCWEINDDEEGVSDEVWWGCTVSHLMYKHEEYGPVWLLKYDEMSVKGTPFPAEERPVAFCSKNLLVDIHSGESKEGGGNIGLML